MENQSPWTLTSRERFVALPLADGLVLYDRGPCKTHVLNLCARLVFDAIGERALTVGQIMARLAADAEDPSLEEDAVLTAQVHEILEGFRTLGVAGPLQG